MSENNRKLNLTLDYGNESAQFKSEPEKQKDFLKTMFENGVNSAFKNGLGKEYMKRFRDINRKIEGAEVTPNPCAEKELPTYRLEVSLTPHEYKFFCDVFERATWNPGASLLVCQMYDILDAAK